MQTAFDLSPHLDDVDKVVQALRAVVEPVLGPQHAMAFEVAVSEALTNIVVHGYANGQLGKDISINLSTVESALHLTILDYGTPGPEGLFDDVPPLDEIDFMQESGRGLALIRHHAQTVTYTPSTQGNQLVLTFQFDEAIDHPATERAVGKEP